ncbi:MAG: ATP phosphoribosyltransferase catalytic subunit HisG, partial [Pseudomonadota bacterium]
MSLRLGLPSKGRLMEKTFDWFAARGFEMSRSDASREYAAQSAGA